MDMVSMTNEVEKRLSRAVREMRPSGIRKFFDLASGKKDVISLGVGEPDFATPSRVRDACVRALEAGRTSYTSNAGMPELREEIAGYLERSFGVRYDPAGEVLVTTGSSEGIDLALRALVEEGDEILVPSPSYISYSPIASLGGGKPVEVETRAEDGFKLTAEALERKLTPRSKVLVLCYPNNPTGAIMTREDWLPIARIAIDRNLIVISDEIYAEMTYGSRHDSIAALPGMKERTLLVSGFSKAFAMTGWRVGYACGQGALIAALLKIHQYTIMCAPTIGQIAAIESLRHAMDEKDEMIASYDRRRKLTIEAFRAMGLPCREPLGSFYVFPRIADTGLDSETFAARLLNEAGVVAVPGNAFGSSGEGHIRCCYATSPDRLQEALDRIGKFLSRI
ncbi:pyridoxal phosphate-dependent aminotransferase [Cohnella zeiphila]|uniref:Aminotransferase n=1 Tax=Cohnella zeiphila TaxID=2761120 RepID=A0A7X0SP40_9BACL|nr:aminotransferase class I/II-fold pyridoxal phosphate-dependent enzyme [Cohnella zeiphila]MBB6733565.1 aminotransferase class I/II-fold pyridoxal phosphate-dependent enzyme [Cohnella zeiphila]